jgi:hypothetical protein
MANPYIGFRCPQDIYDAIEKYLEITDQEKTEYILDLIQKDLGIKKVLNLAEKVEDLDFRLTKLEIKLDA